MVFFEKGFDGVFEIFGDVFGDVVEFILDLFDVFL